MSSVEGVAPYLRFDLALNDVIQIAPAGGATTPNNAMVRGDNWIKVLTVSVVLQTSAVVAGRSGALQALDGNGNIIYTVPAVANQPASLQYVYTWSSTINTAYLTGSDMVMPLPSLVMPSGWSFGVGFNFLQAGDSFSFPILAYVLKIPTGPSLGYERRQDAVLSPTPLIL